MNISSLCESWMYCDYFQVDFCGTSGVFEPLFRMSKHLCAVRVLVHVHPHGDSSDLKSIANVC